MIETENKKHKLFTKYENIAQLKNQNIPTWNPKLL